MLSSVLEFCTVVTADQVKCWAEQVHVEIYYYLPCGSGLPRYRREWYNKMTLAAAPKYEAYTNALGFAEPPVGTFCPGVQITGASMNVTVTALPGGIVVWRC